MKLYHATFEAHLLSIERTGLQPGRCKNWNDCEEGFVYLANDPEVAISYCESAEDTPEEIINSGICCFEVDSKSLEGILLQDDPNILQTENDECSGCFAYAGSIPYSSLRLCWRESVGYIKPALCEQIHSASISENKSQSADKFAARDVFER